MPEPSDFSLNSTRYMEMPSGKRWYMEDPEFDWEDIAYTLAGQPRFNGTARRNEHGHTINVAEHSVRVSYIMQELGGDPLEGLLHDVTEAWLGDVPGPWKTLLPDFCKLEAYLWKKLVAQVKYEYGVKIPLEHTQLLKDADWRALFIEARECMTTQGREWVQATPDHIAGISDMPCYWWSPDVAEARFLMRLHELTHVQAESEG